MNKANLKHMLKSAEATVALIKAKMEEPEERKWVPKFGELCEVWDGCDDEDIPTDPRVSRFHHFDKDGDFIDMEEDGSAGQYYDRYRKLQTSATRRDHDGGECPVDDETIVVVEYVDAEAELVSWAVDCAWSNVIAYWILEN